MNNQDKKIPIDFHLFLVFRIGAGYFCIDSKYIEKLYLSNENESDISCKYTLYGKPVRLSESIRIMDLSVLLSHSSREFFKKETLIVLKDHQQEPGNSESHSLKDHAFHADFVFGMVQAPPDDINPVKKQDAQGDSLLFQEGVFSGTCEIDFFDAQSSDRCKKEAGIIDPYKLLMLYSRQLGGF